MSPDFDPAEDEDGDAETPAQAAIVRARRPARGRWGDLAITLAAIGAVVAAILFVQRWQAGGDDSSPAVAFVQDQTSPGTFSPIKLGPSGGGAPALGKSAPGFRLVDPDGKLIQLEDFHGRTVLVNFWATWCVPCKKEIPDLIALQQEWGSAVQIIGVDYYESPDTVQQFAASFGMNYPVPLDRDGEVTGSYKLTGLPETFFLDGDGVVRDHRIGLLRGEVARCIVEGIARGDHDPGKCR